MTDQIGSYSIAKMCKVLKVSRSAYYRWLGSGPSEREVENNTLVEQIRLIHQESNGIYGSPRITAKLREKGHKVSQKRVARLMKKQGIKSTIRRRWKQTTDSKHKQPISENLLAKDKATNKNISIDRPDQVWVSDITYVPTNEGWLYLTVIIDLFDRQVVGYSISHRLFTKDTVVPAWRMAVRNRKPAHGLIFHSDRGSQYASVLFRNHFKNARVKQSMSGKGNCYDNAVAESFFKTLKAEEVYRKTYQTRKEAEMALFHFIEIWYNRKRLHSSLGYRTPEEYNKEYYISKMAA